MRGTLGLGNLNILYELSTALARDPVSIFQGCLLYKHPQTDGWKERLSVSLLIRYADT